MTPNNRLERRLAKSLRQMPAPQVPPDLRERLMAPAMDGSAPTGRDRRRPLLLCGAAALAMAAWPASCGLFDTPPKAVTHGAGVAPGTPGGVLERSQPSPDSGMASNGEKPAPEVPVVSAAPLTKVAARRTPDRQDDTRSLHPPVKSAAESMVVSVGRKVNGKPDLATVCAQDAGVTVKNESATTPSGAKRQKFTFRDANGREATMSVEAHPAQPEEEEQPK